MGREQQGHDILVDLSEAGKIIGVSRATLYRMIDRGLISTRKVPGDQKTYVTLRAAHSAAKARSLRGADLAIRIVRLESQVDYLLSKTPSDEAREGALEELMRHHPELS